MTQVQTQIQTQIQPKNQAIFRTNDGYRFYFVDGQWVDNLTSENVDQVCDGCFCHGPRDNEGFLLSGGFTDVE